MDDQLKNNSLIEKTRWLSHALIISGALNIGFLGTFVLMTVHNAHRKVTTTQAATTLSISPMVSYVSSDGLELLSEYFEYSYEALLRELESKELVEDGYTKRDYALACLVSFHYFDLHKALAGIVLQTRTLEIIHKEGGERMKLEMFPGLEDGHFQALISFAKLEKWPLTPQGIYFAIQRVGGLDRIPLSLKEAFFLTPQFHCLWLLFNRLEKPLSLEELLHIALDADWDFLDKFYQGICRTQDFSEESRRRFLLSLLEKRSECAANILLHDDREFALTKLDDNSVLFLLSKVNRNTPKAEGIARQLLMSVRSDAVLKAAGYKLYELAGEKPPASYDHKEALLRFLPNFFQKEDFIVKTQRQESNMVNPPLMTKRYHTVVKGECLWKIAASYRVDLKELIKINELSATTPIKPGMKLEIP
jgi:hypothetical protein